MIILTLLSVLSDNTRLVFKRYSINKVMKFDKVMLLFVVEITKVDYIIVHDNTRD